MMIECDNMKNNKGQALVEFIIVLPILIFLIISIIDLGNIMIKTYSLNEDLDTVSDMYISGSLDDIENYVAANNISISYKCEDEFTTIILKKNVKIMSPMLNIAFGKNYDIKAIKTLYEDSNE